jgi:hypothetical protein
VYADVAFYDADPASQAGTVGGGAGDPVLGSGTLAFDDRDLASQAGNRLQGVRTLPPPAQAPTAAAPPADCTTAGTLAPGRWIGSFISRVERRWNGAVPVQSTIDAQPGTWDGRTQLAGTFELTIGDTPSGSPTFEGAASARWTTHTLGRRDDRLSQHLDYHGGLLGGQLALALSGPEAAPGGATLTWQGATWAPPGTGFVTGRESRIDLRDGQEVMAQDPIVAHAAAPLVFTIEAMSCDQVTGTLDPQALWFPGSSNEDLEMVTTAAHGRFRLTRTSGGGTR